MIAPAVLLADNTPISIDLLGFRAAMVMIWVGMRHYVHHDEQGGFCP
jgi:hypothetical protein